MYAPPCGIPVDKCRGHDTAVKHCRRQKIPKYRSTVQQILPYKRFSFGRYPEKQHISIEKIPISRRADRVK